MLAGVQFPNNSRPRPDSPMAPAGLETKLGSEGNFPVVMGPVHENDLVSYFKPQADGTQESFDSPAWIEGRIHVVRSEIIHTAYERGK